MIQFKTSKRHFIASFLDSYLLLSTRRFSGVFLYYGSKVLAYSVLQWCLFIILCRYSCNYFTFLIEMVRRIYYISYVEVKQWFSRLKESY